MYREREREINIPAARSLRRKPIPETSSVALRKGPAQKHRNHFHIRPSGITL